ncbi:MAG: acyloxyacyl hydrolase [Candidatus Omnitrophica bacterium]|nr:acyloxyacyl hydrolase [Candidatus Omnitrophota bacterium]
MDSSNNPNRFKVAGIGLLLLFVCFAGRAEASSHFQEKRWELRAGYGYQYTNESRPNNFQILSLLLSLSVPLTDPIGSSFYRGRWEWMPELHLGLFTHPYVRPLFGITPLQFSYSLEPWGRFSPYVFVGAGVLRAYINRRETGSRINFNPQGGVGTRFRLTDKMSLILEYRHVHMSNAGIDDDNSGIDTHNFLAGISLKE